MFSIKCTTCHARLKVRDESSIGSILPCPKCGSFVEVVRPPVKPSDHGSDGNAPSGAKAGKKTQPTDAMSPVDPRAAGDGKKSKTAATAAAAGAVVPPAVAKTPAANQPVPPAEATGTVPAPPPVAAVADAGDLASADLDAVADVGLDAGTEIPNWTSPTELMWRKWLVLIGAPVAGLVVMVGLLSVFFSSDATPNVSEQKSIETAAEVADGSGEAGSDKKDTAAVVLNRLDKNLMPADTRVVLSLTPAELAGQSGVERLLMAAGPLWTAAISPAIAGLGIELGQIARVTLCATDVEALSDSKAAASGSLIAIEIEPHVDLQALAGKEHVGSDGWPYSFEVLPDTRTIVTGPAELVSEIKERSAANLASRPISQLVENVNPEANLIVLADVAAGGGRRYMGRAKAFMDVWPDGRKAWQTTCETPTGVGLTLRWSAGIQADVALVCSDKTEAQRLDAALNTLMPAARTTLVGRIKRLGEQVGRGEVQPLWADCYEAFLKHGLSAIRPARCEIVDDMLWVRSSWNDDPVSTALTSLDALGPSKTDWMAAGLDCDRDNQKNILKGLENYSRAEGSYPPGAVGGAILPPESRLSWLALLLPYQERRDWHSRLQFGYPWNSEQNTPVTRQTLPTVVNPVLGAGMTEDGFPVTHYVGVAGLGKNAGSLSPGDPKAGVFGFGRKTRPRDIADGASNTIAVLGACNRLGPWSAGGHATVRALTQKPYVNGPDGFGSGQPHGMLAGMADGSTRFISKDVDPRVMEQMVTAAGGHSQAKPTVAAKQQSAATALDKPVDKASADKGLADMSPAVKARLQSRIEKVEFRDIPLSDVTGFVEEFTTLKVEFDRGAMARLGISDRVAVTVDLNNASVWEILEAVLAPHGLACVERNGRLVITARR